MSNTPKRYRLKKDLPGLEAGVIFEKCDDVTRPACRDYAYTDEKKERRWWFSPAEMDANPEWFELIPQEEIKKERIELWGLSFAETQSNDGYWNQFYSNKAIPEEKLTLIKQAIEASLNDDAPPSWVKDSKYLVSTDLGKSHMILISPEELEQAERNAFAAGRMVDCTMDRDIEISKRFSYPTFQDYKGSKKETVDAGEQVFNKSYVENLIETIESLRLIQKAYHHLKENSEQAERDAFRGGQTLAQYPDFANFKFRSFEDYKKQTSYNVTQKDADEIKRVDAGEGFVWTDELVKTELINCLDWYEGFSKSKLLIIQDVEDFLRRKNAVKSVPSSDNEKFALGVDVFRGNLEWDDTSKNVAVFKFDPNGKWNVKYIGRPFDQKKFEADMKEAAEHFSKVPLLCEECGEIGKHKPTCSHSSDNVGGKDWVRVGVNASFILKSCNNERVEGVVKYIDIPENEVGVQYVHPQTKNIFTAILTFDEVLPSLSKSKEPLFVTEDGKDIFLLGKYWFINTESNYPEINWKVGYRFADIVPPKDTHIKTFSTQEAANEYVLMNKKSLSISDLKKVFAPEYVPRIEELMELAKKNLNDAN